MMTVAELLEALEDLPGDMEVRLAVQPSYPFQHALAAVFNSDEEVVYLADGGQVHDAPYLPGYVAEGLGW